MPTIKKRGYAAPKQPEQEIMTFAHKISSLFSRFRKQFTIAASIIAGMAILMAVYAITKSQNEQKASMLVAVAYEYYNPSAGTTPDFKSALDRFREVQQKYPNTMSGAIAQYYVANCLSSVGQYQDAIKEYSSFANTYPGDKFLLGLVYQRMGYASQALGKQTDALKSFEKAESLLGPGVATAEMARLYEASGNMPEAEKKYKTVLDKLMGTSWSMEASGKVQKIAPVPMPAVRKEAK